MFRVVEPGLRHVAAWLSHLPLDTFRRRSEPLLVRSGHYLGLSPDELLASSLISATVAAGLAAWMADGEAWSLAVSIAGLVAGLILPLMRISTVSRARARCVDRAMPQAVELAALCMGAGLDFPRSLQKIVECAPNPRDPLIEEFGHVLKELELGHTRTQALRHFSERTPTNAVREFVNSVVQAEEKGSPLARVLTIQARAQGLRRSVAAEELASGAALMLIGPMALIFLCVIALVLGPLVVRFANGELGVL